MNLFILKMTILGALFFATAAFGAPQVVKSRSGSSCNALPREWSAGSVSLAEVIDRATLSANFAASGNVAPIDRNKPAYVEIAAFGLG